MWNTLQGRFLERTMDDQQVSRVAEHLEPVILPISLIFILWNNVRAILIVQSIALALGALPVYWIARWALSPRSDQQGVGLSTKGAEWLAVAFSLAYLMFPALQAANVADFHADPFVVVPLLFAFWYASQSRYWSMWVWALLAMAVKENLPTLTLMLGLYLVICAARNGFKGRAKEKGLHGLALMVVSLIWFYVATFLIVAPLARQVYGTEGPVYFSHRYDLAGGGWQGWLDYGLGLIQDPNRWKYLIDLFSPVGWLALLAPEFLLLGLPVLVANLTSNFFGQYSGQQHYSAPLVPVFVLAAIFGTQRILSVARGLAADSGRRKQMLITAAVAAIVIWLLVWSIGYHHLRGWTPLARDYVWPPFTSHHQMLDRFIQQIPESAAVSTTPPLHPHLAHRHKVYLYPIVADADFVLLDVSGPTDAHPNDVRSVFEDLLASGEWYVVDAADGYVLLAGTHMAQAGSSTLPDAFYDFARELDAQPEYPVRIDFRLVQDRQPVLRLLGYDVIDDVEWKQTSLRLYWQALAPLPTDIRLWPFVFSEDGFLIEDTALRPMVTSVWYPPSDWQSGEVVVTETLPSELGQRFNLGVAVLQGNVGGSGNLFANPAQRLPLSYVDPVAMPFQMDTWAQIGAFARDGRHLIAVNQPPDPIELDARFADDIRLASYTYRYDPIHAILSVVLRWQVEQPPDEDYTIFVHLAASDGKIVAQSDAQPHWVAEWPSSLWTSSDIILDGHRLALPADEWLDSYQLRVGLYNWQTLQRLDVLDGEGQSVANEVVLDDLRSE